MDTHEFHETVYNLVDEYVEKNMIDHMCPKFYKNMVKSISKLILIPVEDILDEEIEGYIEEIIELYYQFNHIPRSHKTTFRTEHDETIEKQLNYLKNIPQTKQRTEEWYQFRYKHLTASNIWKVFGTQSSYNQLICEKCKPLVIHSGTSVNMDSPMHWGQKYEEVSLLWYQNEYNVKVEDYGCIPHKTIDFIAASPDGIVTTKESGRYGRMLEIKNIVNRDINGIPKIEYWVQMQFQMEVCELEECDFLETRFKEYENEKEFMEDGTFNLSLKGEHKGIIISFIKDGVPYYIYPPFGISEEQYKEWEEITFKENSEYEFLSRSYWRLEEISCILVDRNKLWFEEGKVSIHTCWETILNERTTGYEHRLPKKKQKT